MEMNFDFNGGLTSSYQQFKKNYFDDKDYQNDFKKLLEGLKISFTFDEKADFCLHYEGEEDCAVTSLDTLMQIYPILTFEILTFKDQLLTPRTELCGKPAARWFTLHPFNYKHAEKFVPSDNYKHDPDYLNKTYYVTSLKDTNGEISRSVEDCNNPDIKTLYFSFCSNEINKEKIVLYYYVEDDFYRLIIDSSVDKDSKYIDYCFSKAQLYYFCQGIIDYEYQFMANTMVVDYENQLILKGFDKKKMFDDFLSYIKANFKED